MEVPACPPCRRFREGKPTSLTFHAGPAHEENLSHPCDAYHGCIVPVTSDGRRSKKSIKVALALPKDVSGIDFINGMYTVFKTDLETRTHGALTVEIIYGGALSTPINRMNQMRSGVIQMSDASDGNYATIYPDIQVLNIPYLFAKEQDAWKVLDGPFGQKLADDLRIQNRNSCPWMVGIGWFQALQREQTITVRGRFRRA